MEAHPRDETAEGCRDDPYTAGHFSWNIPPKFSGNEEEWGTFTKDFQEYIKVLSQQKTPADAEALMFFGMSLPFHLKREVEFLGHERGGNVTFWEIMQHFNEPFTRNRGKALRRKLRELSLQKSEKKQPKFYVISKLALRNLTVKYPS